MKCDIQRVSDDFWNIRGSFKIAGLMDVGTQCSLVRLASGRYVFLDSYTLSDTALEEVHQVTSGGESVDAILNLHPFHTMHTEAAHRQFPGAKLYGTERHHRRAPSLPWEPELTDSSALHKRFGEDFEFSVPRGVDFISANQNVHFSSVLAVHRASATLHVDDTFTYTNLPLVGGLRLHPTLAKALQHRPGAAGDFRTWADEFSHRSEGLTTVCAAHTQLFQGTAQNSVTDAMRRAVARAETVLARHEKRFG